MAPRAVPGSRAMLMGFPLVEAEDMPNIGTDGTPMGLWRFRPWLSGGRPGRGARLGAIPIRPSLTCCSYTTSAWAAAYRISTRFKAAEVRDGVGQGRFWSPTTPRCGPAPPRTTASRGPPGPPLPRGRICSRGRPSTNSDYLGKRLPVAAGWRKISPVYGGGGPPKAVEGAAHVEVCRLWGRLFDRFPSGLRR